MYLFIGVWSLPTENNDNNKVTVENISTVSKRQINFHSSQFNQQQVSIFKEKINTYIPLLN